MAIRFMKVSSSDHDEIRREVDNIRGRSKSEEVTLEVASDDGVFQYMYIRTTDSEETNGAVVLYYEKKFEVGILSAIGKHKGIRTLEVDVLNAKLKTWGGYSTGVELSASFFAARASVFDFVVGVGLTTGVGIRDKSFEARVAGTGFTVGRKVQIHVFGSTFGIDFGRFKKS